jgi:hypothetical protein
MKAENQGYGDAAQRLARIQAITVAGDGIQAFSLWWSPLSHAVTEYSHGAAEACYLKREGHMAVWWGVADCAVG